MTWHLDDYRCTLLRGILRRSFQETSPRNTAENTAKHRGGGVGSVVANHRGGGESSVTVTTLAANVAATEWSLLVHDNIGDWVIPFAANALQCIVIGEQNPKTAPSPWDVVTLP